MNIDKYKKEDGYYNEDGCFHQDEESFLQVAILGFCGCGDPQLSLKHVQKGLRQIKNLGELSSVKFKQEFEEWEKENKKLLGGETGVYFMWYFLDREGFSEHGSSVPGWLTEKGKELLEDLDELFN
jgi:hypothetical protein